MLLEGVEEGLVGGFPESEERREAKPLVAGKRVALRKPGRFVR